MTVTLVINGQNFDYPVAGDTGWASDATGWAQAVSTGLLQKSGGSFILTADVDFGTSFGLISPFYKSSSTPRSGTGVLRLANIDKTSWRNFADSADLVLGVGTNDLIEFGGIDLALVTQLVTAFIGLTDTPSSFTSASLQSVRVNVGETALEFFTQDFLSLPDTPSSYSSQTLKSVRVNTGETALEFFTSTFLLNSDTPSNYLSQALNTVRVNVGETALEFFTQDFLSLSDTPASYSSQALNTVRVNTGATALEFFTQNFLALADTPSSFSGQALLNVRVNAGETALEFAAGGGVKTFQNVYDDDVSAAAFDLDSSGSFTINNNLSQALLTISETGIPFRISDAGTEVMSVEEHTNALFGPLVKFNNLSVAISSTVNKVFTLEKYDLTGVGNLRLLGDFAATPTPRITLETGNQRVVLDSSGGVNGDLLIGGTTPFLRLRGGSGTDKRGNVTFISNNPSDQTTNWIGAVVDDTSAIARLFTVRPATDSGTVFTRENSRYIDFFDGSTVRATIQRNGVMTGQMNETVVRTEKHAIDSAPGDLTAEHIFISARNDMTITKIIYIPDASLTADNTNNAILTITRYDSSGGSATTIVAATTDVAGTGNWVAFSAVDLGTLSATTVAAGETLTFKITKGGTGVAVPAGTIQVEWDMD